MYGTIFEYFCLNVEFVSFILCSGYGSQAVSSSNLSSEDSVSIKSISVDDTPDTESARGPLFVELPPVSEVTSSIITFEGNEYDAVESEHKNKQEMGEKIVCSVNLNDNDTGVVSLPAHQVVEEFPYEGTSVVHTALPPGKVIL